MRHTQKGPILRVTTSDFAYDHLDDLIFLLHVFLVGADGTRPSLSTYHGVRAAYRPFLMACLSRSLTIIRLANK